MEKILLYNRGKGESEHLNLNIKMFTELGFQCVPFWNFTTRILTGNVKILYLNWYENIYGGNVCVAVVQYLIKNLLLIFAKIRKVKIIVSMHNKCQHDSKHKKLSAWMYKRVFHSADKIIVFSKSGISDLHPYLSKSSIEQKACFIPPINYENVYPYVEHDWISKLESTEQLNICMVGSLNHPYKNVKMVLRIAKRLSSMPIKFIFAGKLGEEKTEEYNKEIAGYNNILGIFRFIRDDEMAQLLSVSDIIIMPYDVSSISNSGTARLAFSYGRTVICPRVPSLEDIPEDLIFTYTYLTEKEHEEKVTESILKAFSEYCNDKSSLDEKGKQLKKIMQENNSYELIKSRYSSILNSF